MSNIEYDVFSEELFDGRYKMLRPLSTEGGTADVWLAIDMNTVLNDDEDTYDPILTERMGMRVAIKVYRPQNALDIEGERRFRDEYTIVYNCHHTNLLQPYNFSIYNETPYLVMPYYPKGSSEQFVGRMNNNNELWRYIHDVAAGLAYLHALTPPIIHQDVKPANVLIGNDGNYALTDFGISSKSGRAKDSEYGNDVSGTIAYMAPERFTSNSHPDRSSDIWALGATLYEIIVGKLPYGETGGQTQTKSTPMPNFGGKKVDAGIKRLIKECLAHDPLKRPTAAQIEEAASKKMYPLRKKKQTSILPFIATALAVVAIAVGVVFWINGLKNTENAVKEIPVEVAFDDALRLLNSQHPDSVSVGLQRMDSLARVKNYIPAYYEVAYTYGCYSDSLSVQRKKLLGVELGYYNLDIRVSKTLAPYMPVDDQYNQKAMEYMRIVADSEDTTYIDKQMESAHRLGLYYLFYTKRKELAHQYLSMAKKLARKTGNKEKENYIDVLLNLQK